MINNDKTAESETRSSNEAQGGGVWTILGDLASAKLAAGVGGIIVLACILGTLLPQGSEVQKYLAAYPGKEGWVKFLSALGLTNVFEIWWFILLLVLFCCNVSACLIRRLAPRVKARNMGIPGWGFLLTHVSILFILVGAVIRGAIGHKGMLEIKEGQTSSKYMTFSGPAQMPFDVRLVNFEIEYYDKNDADPGQFQGPDTLNIIWEDHGIRTQMVVEANASMVMYPNGQETSASNSFKVVISRYIPDFVIDVSSKEVRTRSEEPRNPAVLVDIEGPDVKLSKWYFAQFPDFNMIHSSSGKHADNKQLIVRYNSMSAARLKSEQMADRQIKGYKSLLQILEEGKIVQERTIEVNSPLSHRGYKLYQSGYNPADLTWSTLQVVCDPGVPFVYAGFLSMIAGLVLLLCLKPAAQARSSEKQPSDQGGLSS